MAKRLPVRTQVELADCGAACLAIVLEYLGRPVSLDEVRDATGSGREGVTALALVDAARLFGLRVRGVRAEVVRADPFRRPHQDAVTSVPADTDVTVQG